MDDVRAELDAIFDNHAAKKRDAETAQAKEVDKAEQFLQSFYRLQNEIINPVMDSFGAYVQEKGFRFKICHQADDTDGSGRAQPARIMFVLYDGIGHGRDTEWPNVAFQCDKAAKEIITFESTMSPHHGGHGGSTGSVGIEAVTKNYVEQKITSLIKQLFK